MLLVKRLPRDVKDRILSTKLIPILMPVSVLVKDMINYLYLAGCKQ